MSTAMRAKVIVSKVVPYAPWDHDKGEPGTTISEELVFHPVSRNEAYPEDGSDENNTYAKFSPSGEFRLTVANPALHGKFAVGDQFYVDFTPVPKE